MRTKQYIGFMLLAALATTGCESEMAGDDILKIYTEKMTREGQAKVLVTPGNNNGDEWVVGEQINLNGTAYPIGYTNDDPANPFFHIVAPEGYVAPDHLYAIYPATVASGGNDIEVVNNGSAASTVLLKRLAVTFRANNGVLDGTHEVYFPMAAHCGAGADSRLLFRHLTGGLLLTLHINSSSSVTLGSIKVALTSNNEVVPIVYSDNGLNVSTQWSASGMALPSGQIGNIEGDIDVSKTSEMHFSLMTSDGGSVTEGVTIAAGAEIKFCVPVTVSSLTRITVAGYTTGGAQHFVKSKGLTNTAIERNKMYSVPTIAIN